MSDDYSAARNQAQAQDPAGADWHLVLDAHEWIESGGPSLRAFCTVPAGMGWRHDLTVRYRHALGQIASCVSSAN